MLYQIIYQTHTPAMRVRYCADHFNLLVVFGSTMYLIEGFVRSTVKPGMSWKQTITEFVEQSCSHQ